MKKIKTILATLFLVILYSCEAITGKEVARLNVVQISTQENLDWKSTTLDLQANEKVYFWAEMDMEYEGDLGLAYQVQVIKGADTLGVMELDPMDKDMTVGEVQTTFGNKN